MSTSVRKRKCNKEKDFTPLTHMTRKICIPLSMEEHKRIINDKTECKKILDKMITEYPELFPSSINKGYKLNGMLPESKKMKGIRLRRILLKSTKEVYTICPPFVMPYMMGYAEDVEKPLFLRRFGVPFWALTYVFGRNDMYWYRLENRFGRNSVVGTTIKHPEKLPEDILADEKHTWENGDKIYIATTVADDCILGASVSDNADAESLTEAYSHFKAEAQNLSCDYEPKTANTDGWTATQSALKSLFSSITVIRCFLHSFLSIRERCKRLKEHFQEIRKRVWEIYHSEYKAQFIERIDAFKVWAKGTIKTQTGLDAILKLCNKAGEFVKAYDYPSAYRTSNMLDRIMDHQDRYLYSCKYFHGHCMSSEYSVRAWALLYNFHPYCPRSKISEQYISPAHKLNGFVYHDNWLQNMLVSSSMGGYRR
jgi:hypothetical protein